MQFEVGNSPVKIGDSKRKEEEKKTEADKEFLPLIIQKDIYVNLLVLTKQGRNSINVFQKEHINQSGTVGKHPEGCILPGTSVVKNKENKIISLFNSKSMFFKFIDEKIEIEGIEKINVTFKNQIEDTYDIEFVKSIENPLPTKPKKKN